MVELTTSSASNDRYMMMQAIYYMFFTKPSPAFGIMDFYVFNPINSLVSKSYKVADLTLRERLGGGNYGQVGLWLLRKAGTISPVMHLFLWSCPP